MSFDIEEMYAEGIKLSEQEKFEEARKIFEKIIQKEPAHLNSLNELGRYFIRKGERDNAEKCFFNILKQDNNFLWAYYNLGVMYRDNNQQDKAYAQFQKVLKIDPNDLDSLNELGRYHHRKKEYSEAKEYFERSYRIDDTYWRTLYNLANLYRDLIDYENSIKFYTKALAYEPENIDLINDTGLCYYDADNFKLSIYYFKKAIEKDKNFFYAWHNLGISYMASSKPEEALEAFNRVLEIKNDYALTLNELGRYYHGIDNFEEAKKYYERTIAADPLFVWAISNLGLLYYDRNNMKMAKKYLINAIEVDPDYAPAYNNLGLCFLYENESKTAIIYLDKAVKVDKNYFQAHYNLGLTYLEDEKIEKAKKHFEESLRINPQYVFPYYGLGRYYLEKNDEEKAVESFKKAVNIDPDFSLAREELGKLGISLAEFDVEREEKLSLSDKEMDDIFDAIIEENTNDKTEIKKDIISDKKEYIFENIEMKEESSEFVIPDPDTDTFLRRNGRNLNELARLGKLTPCFGRDEEIQTILEILFRRFKNNPIIIGPPGVGKTAIVEGLAQRITEGKVPSHFKNKEIIELNTGTLVAGTNYRGQFENKIKQILEEVVENPDIILFIDEIHTVIGAGRVEGGNLDLSQMFKPALARGELTCIGATTLNEYRKYIEKDPAFERRFYPLKIDEMSLESTIEILKQSIIKAEDYYKIKITDKNVIEIVELSAKYLKKRYFPDKAIDIFEKIGSRIALNNKTEIQSNDIKEVIGEMTGINFLENDPESSQKLMNLSELMKKEVFGQNEAIDAICNILKITKRRLDLRPEKPDGVFLFTGPTGVGKTYMSKILCRHLFGKEDKLIRVDMSEFSEASSTAKIIGSPPGYVGYDEPSLTMQIEEHPASILLLDEIEKAHPDVVRIFLQIFDEGRITDSRGKKIYFSDITVIMTSNALVKKNKSMGFVTEIQNNNDKLRDSLNEFFPVEFLNRIDEIIFFNPLTKENIREILMNNIIKNSQERFMKEKIKISFSEELIEKIIDDGYDVSFGARNLERSFEKIVIGPLVNYVYDNECENEEILLSFADNKINIRKIN